MFSFVSRQLHVRTGAHIESYWQMNTLLNDSNVELRRAKHLCYWWELGEA